jgi:hypothetical protein
LLAGNDEQLHQNWLDRLSEKKLDWDLFIQKVGDLLTISRFATSDTGRTVLHLAVLDNRIDVVEILNRDPSLKLRRDGYGLCPVELAQFLGRKECLQRLLPLSEGLPVPDLLHLGAFEYLSYPIFETKEGLEQILAQTAKAKREDKITAEKIWMGIYFDKEIRKGIHAPISIRHIDPEVGYGVFATKKIFPCAYVGEYTGVVQERHPKQLRDKRHCLRYTTWEGRKNFCIDAEMKGNFTRFINHSAKPNLGLQSIYWRGIPRMIFVALREIRENGQLTFDYGPLFWKEFRQPPKLIDDD